MKTLKQYFISLFLQSMDLNKENILRLIEKNPQAVFLDLGCDDGSWTKKVGRKIGTKKMLGIDIDPRQLKIAKKNKIEGVKSDLNNSLPFKKNTIDVVHANQVIEHITDLDKFTSEIFRVLKKGGYAVISTENGSSWHNIAAAILGWQIFSLTNISSKSAGIGNPLAINRHATRVKISSWNHKTIFNYLGLVEFMKVHGFIVETVAGSGYHPLPVILGRLDPRHAHFITIKVRK